jgi:hypothetical protein
MSARPEAPQATFKPILAVSRSGTVPDSGRVFRGNDGLPGKPDPDREPEMYRIWEKMTDKDVAPVKLTLKRNDPPSVKARHQTAPKRSGAPSHFSVIRRNEASSLNWSGAVVPAVSGRRFTRIAAWWQVPPLPDKPEHGGALISLWIGLGGWQGWSNSMPHMGSEHGWGLDGKPLNRLWCQWWQGKDIQDGWISWILEGPELTQGDEIFFYLAVTDANTVECYFLNANTKQLAGVRGTSDRPVIGSSAEWVVERPMHIQHAPGSSSGVRRTTSPVHLEPVGLYPLAQVKSITMHECAARLGDAGDFRRRNLADSDLIELISRAPGLPGTYCELRPKIEATKDGPVLAVSLNDR